MEHLTFEQFMAKVDACLGISHLDLPDYCYRDAYEAGDSPRETAREALAEAGLDI